MSIIIDIDQNGEELDAVNYEKVSKDHLSIFKNPQYKTLFFAFLFFIFVEGLYVFTAVRSPPYVNTTTFFYPITHDLSKTAADVFVHIERLSRYHEFFRMDGAVVRKYLNNSASDPLEIASEIRYAKNDHLVKVINRSKNGHPLRYTCKFDHGAEFSNRFLILNEPIRDFDSINISLLISSTNFKPLQVSGFNFRYSFGQPNLHKYSNSIRLIFSLSTLLILRDYAHFLYSTNRGLSTRNFMFPALLAFLGLTAFLSLNPFELIYYYATSKNDYAVDTFIYKILTTLSPILLSLYMTVYKLFTYYLIDTTIHGSQNIDKNWAIIYGIFIIFFEIIESCAGLPNSNIYKNILKNGSLDLDGEAHLTIFERLLPVLQLIYCATTLLLLSYACKVSTKENKTKFISYSLFISICLLMTFISEFFLSILGTTKNNSISFLFYHTSHLISTILFIYFQDNEKKLFQSINSKDESHSNAVDNDIAPDVEYDDIIFEKTNESDNSIVSE